jgi:hypothetical protein
VPRTLLLGLLGLLLGWPPLGYSEAPAFPDTSSGKTVSGWFEVCASTDLDQNQMTTWLESHLSDLGAKRKLAKTRGEYLYRLCNSNGGFRVDEFDMDKVTVLAEGRKTRVWYSLQFLVNESGKLDGTGDDIVPPPEAALPKDLADAAINRDLNAEAIRLSKSDEFSGIVVVARDDKVVATASVGFADRKTRSPITRDTQFTIGSMSKLFTLR